jgi:putative Ig domain-containing protein
MSVRSTHRARAARYLVILAALFVAIASGGHAAEPGGVFRFLTEVLPAGTTNGEYTARMLTANAHGPVTYGSNPSPMAPGVSIDPVTGLVFGTPTEVNGSGFDVTVTADDGNSVIQLVTKLKITSTGGGGNSGVGFATAALASGRMGAAYTDTLAVENAVGPEILYGASDLPPGLSLDGRTGVIAGMPLAAGTFYATLSATDRGENDNKVFTVLPVRILPAANDFAFTTSILGNGEVGTFYADTWATTDGGAPVTFAAAGLPPGLTVEATTGEVTGDPTTAGLFFVNLTATDAAGDTVTTNRPLWIAPGPASGFHWQFFGLPAAIVEIGYTRQPGILVATENGTDVTYSATGLPVGITYDAVSGELRGTASEVGIYPVVFSAADGGGDGTIQLSTDFLVLPPSGGDAGSLAVNCWIKKQVLSPGDAGSWKSVFIYNADRRTGNAFDPATDPCAASLGGHSLLIDAGGMKTARGRFSFASEKGLTPQVKVSVDPAAQTVKLSSKKGVFADGVPATLRTTLSLGNRGYRLDAFMDPKGRFKATAGYRTTAFVLTKAKLAVRGPGNDQVKLSALLGDPAFDYESGVSTLQLRLLVGGNAILDKTFTEFVTAKERVDGDSGRATFALKRTEKDPAGTVGLQSFRYKSSKGGLSIVLKNADLAGLPPGEAQVGIELTIGNKAYYTSVTLFEGRRSTYSTR